ncbi:T9SS type A sorting domain-containing protein, partial [Flavobacterium sp. xlx-221]|uniref:Ig-like domain-containing protein n=2 Tax=unclassified Flavobacterium TaxID=196869 RepID=UPI0015F537DA
TPAPTAADQAYCIAENKTVADLVVTGTNVKWYANATITTPLNPTDVLTNSTYYATQTVNGCESVSRTPVVVTIHNTAAPTAADQAYCIAENKTVADLVVTGTNVKWYANATITTPLNLTDVLTNGTYYATQTVNGCESVSRTPVVVTIHNTAAPTATDQAYCIAENKTVADLVVTGTNVKWYANATITTPLNPTDVLTNSTYYATQTVNGCESVSRTPVVVTIHNTPAPTATDQAYCIAENKTVADLVVTGTNVTWYANATITTPLNPTDVLTNSTYYATQTVNGCESVSRTPVVVTIHNTPAPTAADQAYCIAENKTVADLVVTGTNVKWYANATITTPLNPTDVLTNSTYYATQTVNGCESVLRTPIVVTIHNTAAPTAVDQAYCIAENKKVADLVVTGTNVKWYANATITTSLNPTDVLVSGIYYASQTLNGCESVSRTPVVVTIHNTATPTAVDQAYCIAENKKVADLVVTGTDVKWYNSATATTPLNATDVLVSGIYYASQTLNGCESVSRTPVVITIHNTPAPTAADQAYCIAENKKVADLVVTGTNVKWYANATITTPLNLTDVLTNGTYYATQTVNGCESVSRTPVVVTIHNTAAPTATDQAYCIAENKTVADLVVTGTNVKWYANATITTPLNPTDVLTNSTYYATQTVNGCESVSRTPVVVTIHNTAAPTAADQAYCIAENKTVADLVVTGTDVKWYNGATATTPLNTTDVLVSGTYYASQTLNGCESVLRTPVVVTIHNTAAPTAVDQAYCIAENKKVADLVVTGTDVKWYNGAAATTPLNATDVLTNGTYYASQTLNGCESVLRTPITVTIHNTVAPTAVDQAFCIAENKKVADLVVTGTNVKWYANATITTPLNPTDVLTNGTYYATQIVNGCESVLRTPIKVTIYNTSAPTAIATQSFCGNQVNNVSNLLALGTAVKWYNASVGGSLLNATDLLTNNTIYYATQTLNGCESILRTAVKVVLNDVIPITSSAITVCAGTSIGQVKIDTFNAGELKWYSSLTSPNPLSTTTILTAGTYYVSTYTNNGCLSDRKLVQVTIINQVPPVIVSNQTFCGAAEVKDLVAQTTVGAVIKWYSSFTSTQPLAPNTPLANGTFYVEQQAGMCSSVRTAVAIRVISLTAPIMNNVVLCNGATVNDIPANQTSPSQYIWYINNTTTTPLQGTHVLSSGVYYVANSQNGCISNRAQVYITINAKPNIPTGNSIQTFTNNATVANLQMNETNIIWFDSYVNAVNNANALSKNHILQDGATYYAVQVGPNGCFSDPIGIKVVIVLGTTDFDLASLTYYPNPVDAILTIQYIEPIQKITVYDVLGKRIMQKEFNSNEIKVDFSPYSMGTYMVRIETVKGSQFIKIIKK